MSTETSQVIVSNQPRPGGYWGYLSASWGHALILMVRRQRIVLAALITFLPVLIPLAMAFLSPSQFAEDGSKVFSRMMEQVHIDVLAPLLALFFASMMVGEDIELQTIPYVLTRPIPRSAWVLGRYFAYMTVASIILVVSCALAFAACTALEKLAFDQVGLTLLAHYSGVCVMALLGYGAVAIFLGATTRRPIVIGVVLLYGWQRLAMTVPGLIDFMTIQKYTDALLPKLATQRNNVEVQTMLGTFQKEVFAISAGKAGIFLVVIAAAFLIGTVIAVRVREFSAARAIGG
jgi:ABC-type transport system involved in multi-copper enzyme maturation permease subunit